MRKTSFISFAASIIFALIAFNFAFHNQMPNAIYSLLCAIYAMIISEIML